MIVAEFSITPVTGDKLKPYIDAAVNVVKRSGLKYEVDALSTTIEGDIDQIFEVVKKAHNAVMQQGADRVLTEIRIDDRRAGVTIQEEVEAYRASV
ncbi:MAG: MTH1187 family thiamine-binding protein [Armatimonadota bacterium]|nr:MTH1187 family thiamine-binding protein [bacterium]